MLVAMCVDPPPHGGSPPHPTHPLLLPPASVQLFVQPVGSDAPLCSQPADPSLHEAQRLLARAHLLQEGTDISAEGRLQGWSQEG